MEKLVQVYIYTIQRQSTMIEHGENYLSTIMTLLLLGSVLERKFNLGGPLVTGISNAIALTILLDQ
jgi:hypothetical protein